MRHVILFFCSFLGSVRHWQSCCLSLGWVMLLWSMSLIWRGCVQLFSIRSSSLPVLTPSPQTLMNPHHYRITKVSLITTNQFSDCMEPGNVFWAMRKYATDANRLILSVGSHRLILGVKSTYGAVRFLVCGLKRPRITHFCVIVVSPFLLMSHGGYKVIFLSHHTWHTQILLYSKHLWNKWNFQKGSGHESISFSFHIQEKSFCPTAFHMVMTSSRTDCTRECFTGLHPKRET